MRKILPVFVLLVWGLWFGGLIVLFLAVSSLFVTFADRHDIAGEGAAHIFRLFNAYQLMLATLALVATLGWRLLGPPRLKEALFTVFALATFAACVITIYVAPQIALIQKHGLTHSPEFARMHGLSMVAYLVEAILLAVAGCILPSLRE